MKTDEYLLLPEAPPTGPTAPAPKKHPTWLWIVLGVITALVVGGGIGMLMSGEEGQPRAQAPAVQEPTVVTVTESAPPPVEAVVPPEPVGGQASNGDLRACQLLELASTRQANSPSWIDIVGDASFKATDYDLMDAIDKAYWTSGDALAAERIDLALARCGELIGD